MKEIILVPYLGLLTAGFPVDHIRKLVEDHIKALDFVSVAAKEEAEAAKVILRKFCDERLK
jgi:hypothetical protein